MTATSPLGGLAVEALDPEHARLRAELAELRAENAELRRDRQLLTEQLAALAEVNRELRERVAELERRLSANSRNSHRPPSSEGYAKPRPRSRRDGRAASQGASRDHRGRRCARSMTRTR